MIARDVEMVSTWGATTYAQVVERSLTAERLEEKIRKDLATRRDARKNAFNNTNDQKIKFSEGSRPYGADKKVKDDNDSAATHSYVADRIVDKFFRPFELNAVGFRTMLPTGEVVITRRWIRALPMWVDNREIFVDLIELGMKNFDVILGMDWLAKYGVTIDCKKKMVKFKPIGEESFMFLGITTGPRIPIITLLKAKEMLHEGCIGFLANVIDIAKEAVQNPEETKVVQEFLDVFPEDLLGLPPH
ncbi:uncharacterized protein LOC133799679 [Humulus lupulus]|uniref:uncharacterized protein LOC133799679 n=1 Tax=Humulus lupulus TaxID=3486 RepID=UPI002B40C379|nr:uncharacterized protein LOC133799679 [Humulus lupulus]